jgi:transposase-like protein
MDKIKVTKEELIAEYLAGGTSYRKLETKYGITSSTIADWVHRFEGRHKTWRDRMKRKQEIMLQKQRQAQIPPLPENVKQLQAALRKAELHNKLLEEILKLSEEHTGLELRKKFGTRQSSI